LEAEYVIVGLEAQVQVLIFGEGVEAQVNTVYAPKEGAIVKGLTMEVLIRVGNLEGDKEEVQVSI